MAFTVPTIFTAVDKFSTPVMGMTNTLETFANKAVSGLARGERAFRNIKHGADEAFEKIINIKNAIAAVVVGETTKKIYEVIEGTAELGEQSLLTAKRLGLQTEAYQELKFAANIAGISADEFTTGMEKLNISVGQLHAKTGRLYSMLQKSNPALARQLRHAKTNEQAFNLMSAAIEKLKSPLDKAALANRAFGGSGSKMLNLISKGKVGIAELREEAKKYGGVIGSEAAEQSERFIETQKKMDFAIMGVKNSIGLALMPVLQGLMERLTDWIGKNGELIKDKIQVFVTKFTNGIIFLADHIGQIIIGIKLFVGALILFKAASIASTVSILVMKAATIGLRIVSSALFLVDMVRYVAMTRGLTIAQAAWAIVTQSCADAMVVFNAVLAANPIGLTILAIAALIALVVVIIKKWNDWGAALSLFLGPLGLIIGLIQSFRRNWDMITMAFKTGGILAGLKAIGKTILDAVLMPLQQVLSLIAKFTGANWATNAAKGLEKFRADMGVNVETDENGKPLPGKKVVDTKTAAHQATIEKREQTNNAHVGLTIDNRTGNTVNASNPNGVKIKIGSTFAIPSN